MKTNADTINLGLNTLEGLDFLFSPYLCVLNLECMFLRGEL